MNNIRAALVSCHRFVLRLMRAKTVGVRAMIINERDEILLVRHTYRDGWHTPGGGVNLHEDPETAVRREVREETGFDLRAFEVFGVYLNKWGGADDYPIMYVAKCQGGGPSPIDSAEISECKWFPLDDLPSDITTKTHRRISEYLGKCPRAREW